MRIIPLKWLCDTAARELEKRAPAASMKYQFDDGTLETCAPDVWIPATARQTAQHRIMTALSEGKITLLNAFGAQAMNPPDGEPKQTIERFAVSHADAVRVLELCGLGLELLERQTPEQILQSGREQGLTNDEIVRLIDTEYSSKQGEQKRLSHVELADLLFPDKINRSIAARKKHGQRLRDKKY